MDNNEFLSEYRTGDVQPPKEHQSAWTAILLTVLFFGCVASGLSFANVELFSLLEDKQAATSVRFEGNMRLAPVTASENYTEIHSLGIQGRFLSALEQRYFGLPEGVYIQTSSRVVPGLCAGDVLLAINGEEITNQDMLDAVIESHAHGAALTLTIYRDGHEQTISAILSKYWEDHP